MYKFNVIIKLNTRCWPITGCHNRVEAFNAVEALNKTIAYHKYKVDDIIDISVTDDIEFPPLPTE